MIIFLIFMCIFDQNSGTLKTNHSHGLKNMKCDSSLKMGFLLLDAGFFTDAKVLVAFYLNLGIRCFF